MAAQEGAMVKRFHSGRAAQSGVYAASLAASDFTGITDVLEAPYGGYLTCYSNEPNPARLTAGLGSTWETLNVGYKPHASVTSIHTALDGLAEIMRENALESGGYRARGDGLESHDARALRLGVQGAGRYRGADESLLRARGDRARRHGFHGAVPRRAARAIRRSSTSSGASRRTSIPKSRAWARRFAMRLA